MTQAPVKPPRLRARAGSGEPLVWLTGMGLVVGLSMITALLAMIVWNGVGAFWPMRLSRLELTPEAAARLGQPALLAHIIETNEKRVGERDARGKRPMEYKLQVGNRDLVGSGYLFLDVADVAAITEPLDAVRIERIEYGPALGTIVSLQEVGAPAIAGDSPQLQPTLERLIASVNARRAQIETIEKHEIGRVNAEMLKLRAQRRTLEARTGSTPGGSETREDLALGQREAELQSTYERLASDARELRAQQEADQLTYRISNGMEKTLPLGSVVYAYFPNQLSFAGRLGVFFHNIWVFVSDSPREANTEGGIFPALFGTFVMTIILSVAVTPFGVIAAIYLREYAKDGVAVRAVRIAINNLAGVPSIVFGVFGLGFFVYVVGGSIDSLFYRNAEGPVFGTGGILWASLTLALMTVPVVIVATEEALASVARGAREGSLACGASKWQTIQRVVLPAAAPGIITGMILAMARGAGEVAPLMITGVVKLAPTLPVDSTFPFLHLDRKFMHLGFHIYDVGFQSPDSDAARPMVFATTLLLIVLIVAMNLAAIVIRERLRRKYSTGAF